MFSAGDAYERFMGRWSRVLAPQLVRLGGVQDGDDVLDVGSGTGALAAAVRAVAPSCHVTGIDVASAYVDYARSRPENAAASFEVGDAQQMRFPDGRFDRTLSLLNLNFIPDPNKAVQEMIRVTRAGGTVTAAVWDYGEGMEMLRGFWDEAVGIDASGAIMDESHMPLCRRGELGNLWREHGMRSVIEDALTITMQFSSFNDYWSPFLERQGPAGAHVAALSEEAREQVRLRLRRRLTGGGEDHPITLSARAWAVSGTVDAPADREP